MDILVVIIVLLVLLLASTWSSARSYFVKGRLAAWKRRRRNLAAPMSKRPPYSPGPPKRSPARPNARRTRSGARSSATRRRALHCRCSVPDDGRIVHRIARRPVSRSLMADRGSESGGQRCRERRPSSGGAGHPRRAAVRSCSRSGAADAEPRRRGDRAAATPLRARVGADGSGARTRQPGVADQRREAERIAARWKPRGNAGGQIPRARDAESQRRGDRSAGKGRTARRRSGCRDPAGRARLRSRGAATRRSSS